MLIQWWSISVFGAVNPKCDHDLIYSLQWVHGFLCTHRHIYYSQENFPQHARARWSSKCVFNVKVLRDPWIWLSHSMPPNYQTPDRAQHFKYSSIRKEKTSRKSTEKGFSLLAAEGNFLTWKQLCHYRASQTTGWNVFPSGLAGLWVCVVLI